MNKPGPKSAMRTWLPATALAFLLVLPVQTAFGYGGGGGGGGDVGGTSSEASTPPTGYTPAASGSTISGSSLSGVTISNDWAAGQTAEESALEQASYDAFTDAISQEGMETMEQEQANASQMLSEEESQAAAEAEAQALADRHQAIHDRLNNNPEMIENFEQAYPTLELQEHYIELTDRLHALNSSRGDNPDDPYGGLSMEEHDAMENEIKRDIERMHHITVVDPVTDTIEDTLNATRDLAVTGALAYAGTVPGIIGSVTYTYIMSDGDEESTVKDVRNNTISTIGGAIPGPVGAAVRVTATYGPGAVALGEAVTRDRTPTLDK
ncbi:hypothetical protein [uncultured Pseudodesulfovibrio sp.]|uniref:hypothetical protein n=1 Tax=uncultured Pseudodesulfovibrio sp. TaxID=2035858 RepID=UPI0029C94DB6|nr:hypothetical protein [uncultured Pseudodesulfovibrio sp.]